MSKLDDALEILDVADWLESYATIKRASAVEIRLQDCPKCGNSKFKLYVNTSNKRWYCQRCGWGKFLSDICVLLSEVSNRHINEIKLELAQTVVPSVKNDKFIDALSGLLNGQKQEVHQKEIEPVLLPGTDEFVGLYGQKILAYANFRGLSELTTKRLKLRAAAKLRNAVGPFLVFPVFYRTMPVAWQGRRITNDTPSYISADDIKDWLWPLQIDDIARIEKQRVVVIVEGVFDALGVLSTGLPALCTFGKNISARQLKLLSSLHVETVYVAWDFDAYAAIESAIIRLSPYYNVRVVPLEPPETVIAGQKTDPGDILKNPSLCSWFMSNMTKSFTRNDPMFFEWQLENKLRSR